MMKMIAAAVCLVAGTLLPCAAQQPLSLRFYKDVNTNGLKQEEIIAPILDSDVYAATVDGFPDLRVFDKKGSEVPYLLEKLTETRALSVRRTAPAKQVSLRELPEGGLEIQVARAEQTPPADGISLVTPLTNYQQRAQVSGSNDGQDWQALVSDALIFDHSRYMDVSNRQIGLPENRYRFFRIVIRDVTSDQESQLLELTRRLRGGQEAERVEKTTIQRRPFRIDRIEFSYHVSQEDRKGDKKTAYPVASFKVEQNAGQRQTLIQVHTRREPLTGFHLETASRNFSRRVAIQVPVVKGVRTEWHDVATATISRIDFRDLHREELMIPFPETRQELYRIVIDNGDNPTLEITGIRGEGNTYRLLLLAMPDVDYRLFYGSEMAKARRYDTAAMRESLGGGYQPITARLSEQLANPGVSEPAGKAVRGLFNNPLVLGGLIVVLVVVLAWGLYRAGRRIEQLPKDPGGAAS
jgi:hypothetical protein